MNRYRKIDPRFWKDEKIVAFVPEEKLVALYLFTGQSNRIGLFSFSPGEARGRRWMLPQTFAECFGNVCRALNLGWDETFRVLYLPTWWKYNPPENSNNVIGNLKDLDDVSKSDLIDLFRENLDYLAENLRETFTQTLAKRYPKRSPSQEQEQEYKSGAKKAPSFGSSPSRRGRKPTRARVGAIEADLQPAVSRVVGRINELSGKSYDPESKITPAQLRVEMLHHIGFVLPASVTVFDNSQTISLGVAAGTFSPLAPVLEKQRSVFARLSPRARRYRHVLHKSRNERRANVAPLSLSPSERVEPLAAAQR
jgi:hypothetical protein